MKNLVRNNYTVGFFRFIDFLKSYNTIYTEKSLEVPDVYRDRRQGPLKIDVRGVYFFGFDANELRGSQKILRTVYCIFNLLFSVNPYTCSTR